MKPVETARWKLWLLRWIGLYPTLLLAHTALGPVVAGWPLALRLLVMSGIGTFALSFVVMPAFTRWFAGWLGSRS